MAEHIRVRADVTARGGGGKGWWCGRYPPGRRAFDDNHCRQHRVDCLLPRRILLQQLAGDAVRVLLVELSLLIQAHPFTLVLFVLLLTIELVSVNTAVVVVVTHPTRRGGYSDVVTLGVSAVTWASCQGAETEVAKKYCCSLS